MFKEFFKCVKKITQSTLTETFRARICLEPRRISHQLLVFLARVRKTKRLRKWWDYNNKKPEGEMEGEGGSR